MPDWAMIAALDKLFKFIIHSLTHLFIHSLSYYFVLQSPKISNSIIDGQSERRKLHMYIIVILKRKRKGTLGKNVCNC